MMYSIRLYTKKPAGVEYPSALAYSVHMAVCRNGEQQELFQGYGMLFAKGVIRSDNTIEEKGLCAPCLLQEKNGRWGIAARRVNHDGTPDQSTAGFCLYWESRDLIAFEEKGLLPDEELTKRTGMEAEALFGQAANNGFHETEITKEMYEQLLTAWTPVHAVRAEVAEQVCVQSCEELQAQKAKVWYSDGSVHEKKVLWETDGVDFAKPGQYEVSGTIQQQTYPFPCAEGYADPVVFHYADKWYFLATNDNTDDIGMFVREADTVEGLFTANVREYCILEQDETRGLVQTFWAPEFHLIGGRLYILFAVSGSKWGPQCHMMRLKENGSIIRAQDWEEPIRVARKDLTPLCTKGITLDMTYFTDKGRSYVVWSERYGIGSVLDSGSMLYIAEISEETPWILKSDPVLLSRPVYGWENQSGTINNEGPYPLKIGDRLYLAYSGGAAGGYSYVVGLFELKEQGDVLLPSSWKKPLRPALSAFSVEGQIGTGHNAFYRDEAGDIWITYHAKDNPDAMRSSTIRRVHIGADGRPLLNLSAERDLPPQLKRVHMTVISGGTKRS